MFFVGNNAWLKGAQQGLLDVACVREKWHARERLSATAAYQSVCGNIMCDKKGNGTKKRERIDNISAEC